MHGSLASKGPISKLLNIGPSRVYSNKGLIDAKVVHLRIFALWLVYLVDLCI